MKKIIISFGGVIKEEDIAKDRHFTSYGIIRNYSAEVRRLFKIAERYEFDGYWEYDANWLFKFPWSENTLIVLREPSFGWAFKSISIYDALTMMDDGDCVLWMDSNDILISDPQPLLDFAKKYGIYSHDHTPTYYANKFWTQRDMFINMGCDEEQYWDAPQIQVNIMAFCKSPEILNFVGEWVKYSTDYETMIQNIHSNLMGFQEHRHEQSVFSILRQKYQLSTTKGYPGGIAKEEMGIDVRR